MDGRRIGEPLSILVRMNPALAKAPVLFLAHIFCALPPQYFSSNPRMLHRYTFFNMTTAKIRLVVAQGVSNTDVGSV